MDNKTAWIIIIVILLAVLVGKFIRMNTNKPVDVEINVPQQNMKIESTVFQNDGNIPIEYTCDGAKLQPPLQISGVSEQARSLALIVDDPDAPNGEFVHWVVWNIDPSTTTIEGGRVPEGASEGYTGLNAPGWVAPCPPTGIHHYNFKLYALDTALSTSITSNKADLLRAMETHIVGNATLVGLYGKDLQD